ncbi:LysE family transporter [Corynebacterium propinquum]|uniref:LysE family translocator n=1 Tax=Corynebacterium propinquum TaxID=43769 RepID=UPI00254A456E|nr:LysE family transporter [Corynebacterium propinquum]MDK8664961.1 LysE family transporter [Corynebacterium propinquum]
MLTDILSWAAVMALPGPDIVAIGTQVSRHGHRAGFATATGATVGVATWSILSLAGITALLTAVPALSVILPVLGSSVLIVLGLLAIKGALSAQRAATRATTVNRSSPESSVADLPVPAGSTTGAPATPTTQSTTAAQHAPVWFRAFRLGLITNLSNPKALVFFSSFFTPLMNHYSGVSGKASMLGILLLVSLMIFSAMSIVMKAASHVPAAHHPALKFLPGVVFLIIGTYYLIETIS